MGILGRSQNLPVHKPLVIPNDRLCDGKFSIPPDANPSIVEVTSQTLASSMDCDLAADSQHSSDLKAEDC